jgi:flagellar basal-body rod protein FlgB
MTATQADFTSSRVVESDSADETLSGNSVNLEQEMIKLGDVNRAYSMDTNIKRAIHQLMMSAAK